MAPVSKGKGFISMSRGQHYLKQNPKNDSYQKIEKIKKGKRSEKGRVFDDWIIDTQNKKTKKEATQKLKDCLKNGFRYGRVIEVQKGHVFIAEEDENKEPMTDLLWFCSIARRHFQRSQQQRNFVVVGDRILFTPDRDVVLDDDQNPVDTDLPRGVVEHALPRENKIARKDPLNKDLEHILLVNIGAIAIVASVKNPTVRWGLIDRFLVQAEAEDIPVVLILNKVDLLEDDKKNKTEFYQSYENRVENYRKIGYQVFEISSLKPKKYSKDIKAIKSLFKGKIVGLTGHSGVGKSSLINLMKPEFEQDVDDNPDIFYKGRHTTTFNSLISLGIGGYAIDTPGIRSFDIFTEGSLSLSHCFPEFRPYKCPFRECAHNLEEECAIKKAVHDGLISPERYRSYLGILTGKSFREGEVTGQDDALMIADLKAREQMKEFKE